jgi:hypothetical protein
VAEQVERRNHRRLPLTLPLIVSGGRESGHFVEETASENVSAGGVFFRTDAWAQMPVGTRVYLSMDVTLPNGLFAHPSRLKTVGRVVRLGPPKHGEKRVPPGSRGVAVQFERALRFSS